MSRGRRRAEIDSADESVQGHTLRTGLNVAETIARSQPGDAIVLDVLDMDRSLAASIVSAGVGAVVNVSPSYSGRFPATGPMLLVDAGVTVVDSVGTSASFLRDGERVEITGNSIVQHDKVVAQGRLCTAAILIEDAARAELSGGVRTRTEALLSDTVALLRTAGAELKPDSALIEAVRGNVVLLIAGMVTPAQARLAASIVDVVVATAGPEGLAGAKDLKVVADIEFVGDADRRRSNEDVDNQPLAVVVSDQWSLVEGAAWILFNAGARSVVIGGTEVVDESLIALMDRPREETASSALARLDGGGRLVTLSTLEILTRESGEQGRLAGFFASPQGRMRWFVGTGVALLLTGIVLGATVLVDVGPFGKTLAAKKSEVAALTQANEVANQRISGEDSFLDSAQSSLIANQLKGRKVVVVLAPGIAPETAAKLNEAVTQAGGTVTGGVALSDKFIAVDQQVSLDDLATRLAPVGTAAISGEPGTRVQVALADAISTADKAAVGVDNQQAKGFLDALASVQAITLTGTPSQKADLVIFVVPDSSPSAQATILSDVGGALAGNSVVTVIATPGNTLKESALVKTWNAPSNQARLSVAEEVGKARGRIAAVYALAAGAKGRYGTFGAIGTFLNSLK
jgi:hypothetical protein